MFLFINNFQKCAQCNPLPQRKNHILFVPMWTFRTKQSPQKFNCRAYASHTDSRVWNNWHTPLWSGYSESWQGTSRCKYWRSTTSFVCIAVTPTLLLWRWKWPDSVGGKTCPVTVEQIQKEWKKVCFYFYDYHDEWQTKGMSEDFFNNKKKGLQ